MSEADEIYEAVESVIEDMIAEYEAYIAQDASLGDSSEKYEGAVEALKELLYRLNEQ